MASSYSSLSPYQYALNNPIMNNDPTGLYHNPLGNSGGSGNIELGSYSSNGTNGFDFTGPQGAGSGHHWSDQYRSLEDNFALMSGGAFESYYRVDLNNPDDVAKVVQSIGDPGYLVTTDNGSYIYLDNSFRSDFAGGGLNNWYQAQDLGAQNGGNTIIYESGPGYMDGVIDGVKGLFYVPSFKEALIEVAARKLFGTTIVEAVQTTVGGFQLYHLSKTHPEYAAGQITTMAAVLLLTRKLGRVAPKVKVSKVKIRATRSNTAGLRNGHLAGKRHPKTGVPFTKSGFPNFKKYLYKGGKNDVTIKPTGTRSGDFSAANEAAGYESTPSGYTWHHHQSTGRMQLVERVVHQKTGHTGGFSIW